MTTFLDTVSFPFCVLVPARCDKFNFFSAGTIAWSVASAVGEHHYFVVVTSFALLALALKLEEAVCRKEYLARARLGADEVCGIIAGMENSNAMTLGGYDATGRHQLWGVIVSSLRTGEAWKAVGEAFASAFDWIKMNNDILSAAFGKDWPMPVQVGPDIDPLRMRGGCSNGGVQINSYDVILAFPPVSFEDDKERAFGHLNVEGLRFEMLRDGGTAIDHFFDTWPFIFKDQCAIMCHHHDVARVKPQAKELIKTFVSKGWKGRVRESSKGGNPKLLKEVQLYWDAERTRSKNRRGGEKKHFFEDVWKTYFNGMFDAWCHTHCPKRKEALLEITCRGMADMGLIRLATYLRERYAKGTSRPVGKMTRCEMDSPRGPNANAGNEGGCNKRMQTLSKTRKTIGRTLDDMKAFVVSDGRHEWTRPGVLLRPDATNDGHTENGNSWPERRGADSNHAWGEAVRLVDNYFKKASGTSKDWIGIHAIDDGNGFIIASQAVRDYCDRYAHMQLVHKAENAKYSKLKFEKLLGSALHVQLIQSAHSNVYQCWLKYTADPLSFLTHVQKKCFDRTEEETRAYWADFRKIKRNRVTDWLLVFEEAIFYERAFCTCTVDLCNHGYVSTVDVMPEKWRPRDHFKVPLNYLRFKCDCLMFLMHGYCGSTLACGLYCGQFSVPQSKNKTDMGERGEEDFKNKFNATPDKLKTKYALPKASRFRKIF